MEKIGDLIGDCVVLPSNDKRMQNYMNNIGEAPKPVECEFCGRTLYYEGYVMFSKVCRWSEKPQECNCEGAMKQKELEWQKELERKKKQEQQEIMLKIAKLQDKSLIGEKYKTASFDNTIVKHNKSFEKAFEKCRSYCNKADDVIPKGLGIYLYGNSGTGKTHLTACMANELMKQYRSVLFTNFFEISKAIRNTYNKDVSETEEKILNQISDIEVLFIDDLGTESLSKNDGNNFLQDKIFEVVNARYNNKKATIFTSNYSIDELADRGFMPKTIDRIYEMATAKLEIKGSSFRRVKMDTDEF